MGAADSVHRRDLEGALGDKASSSGTAAMWRNGAVAAVAAVGAFWARSSMIARGLRSSKPWGSRALALSLANAMRAIATFWGVVFTDDTREKWGPEQSVLDPHRQYVVSWHPHGAFTFTPAFYTNELMTKSTLPDAPGLRNWFVSIADIAFRVPVVGEAMLLWNARSASFSVVADMIRNGVSVTIQPGGVPEQVLTDCTHEKALFPPQLGWIKLAIQHGLPLLPVYSFGENQVFGTSKWSRRFSSKLHGLTGFPLPLFCPIPSSGEVHMRWGRPIEVIEQQDQPEQWQVERLFGLYVRELMMLFDEHKEKCLPAAVAERGLTVVWRGHTAQELEAVIASAGGTVSNSLHMSDYERESFQSTNNSKSQPKGFQMQSRL